MAPNSLILQHCKHYSQYVTAAFIAAEIVLCITGLKILYLSKNVSLFLLL